MAARGKAVTWRAVLGANLAAAGALEEAYQRGYYDGAIDTVTGRAKEFFRGETT